MPGSKRAWGWLLLAATIVGASLCPVACRDFKNAAVHVEGAAAGAAGDRTGSGGTDRGGMDEAHEGGASGASMRADSEGAAPSVAGTGGVLAGSAGATLDSKEGGRNAGGDAGADQGGALERAPQTFDSLSLWLEASPASCSVGNDERVSHCTDLSPHGNDASQPDPSEQPQLIASVINGHDVLRFEPTPEPGVQDDAHDLVVADAPSLRLGVEDFICAIVGRWKNSDTPRYEAHGDSIFFSYSGFGGLITKVEDVVPYAGLVIFANYPSAIQTAHAWTRFTVQLDLSGYVAFSYSDRLNDSQFRLYLVRRAGSDLSIRINGRQEGGMRLRPELNLDAFGSSMFIGGRRGQPVDGDIAELAIFKGATADEDVSGLERHYLRKYDLN